MRAPQPQAVLCAHAADVLSRVLRAIERKQPDTAMCRVAELSQPGCGHDLNGGPAAVGIGCPGYRRWVAVPTVGSNAIEEKPRAVTRLVGKLKVGNVRMRSGRLPGKTRGCT